MTTPSQRPARGALRRLLAALLLMTAVAGCHAGVEGPYEPAVEIRQFTHEVPFASGRGQLGSSETAALQAFLSEIGAQPGDRAYVLAEPAAAAGSSAVLAGQRADAVMARLAAEGLQPQRLPADSATAGAGATLVIVERTVVVLPACPDWTDRPGWTYHNTPHRNWSCATAVNFGMMVAEPADLLRGRTPGPANGERLGRAFERYRLGRVKDLIRDSASSEIFPTAAPAAGGSK
jgi:pilus biogenesis lipoprotein CpaD